MNIYSALLIGDYHLNPCEDFLITKSIGSHKTLCAVMDGCSTVMEIQFASALTGKILRKICTGKSYEEMYPYVCCILNHQNGFKKLIITSYN